MKIAVVTNENGKIIGTLRLNGGFPNGQTHAEIVASPGQKVYELNLPELSGVEPLSKLHGRSLRLREGRAELAD
jgi:hypothetical protein